MKILFTGSQSLSNKLIDDFDTEFEILFDYDVQTLSFDISVWLLTLILFILGVSYSTSFITI